MTDHIAINKETDKMYKSTNMRCNSTSRSNKRRTYADTQDNAAIAELERLVLDLYSDGRCGRAAAEYNLVKAGAIEVASGHVPGHLREDDVFFEHSEWKLTELGKRASAESLTSIILRDPPLEIALWDAMNEARDVADNCGGCEPDDPLLLDHRHLLAHLLERVERIRSSGRY
jgi:hypothetical protein